MWVLNSLVVFRLFGSGFFFGEEFDGFCVIRFEKELMKLMLLCWVVLLLVGIRLVLIQIMLCCMFRVNRQCRVDSLLLFMVVELVKVVLILFFYFWLNQGLEEVLVNFLNCQDMVFMQVGELKMMVLVVFRLVYCLLVMVFLVLMVISLILVLVMLVVLVCMVLVCFLVWLQLEW